MSTFQYRKTASNTNVDFPVQENRFQHWSNKVLIAGVPPDDCALFFSGGAEPSIRDTKGRTARDLASEAIKKSRKC
jgi:hypothetical protein